MTVGNRLLLCNHHFTDLEFSFLWSRGRRQPTVPCRVPFCGLVDIGVLLPELTKEQARAVIEASPDFIKARAALRVELIDESNPPEVRIPDVVSMAHDGSLQLVPLGSTLDTQPGDRPPMGGDPLPPINHADELPLPPWPRTTKEDGQRMIAEEKAATAAFLEAQARSRGEAVPDGAPDAQALAETGEPEAAGALEPGMKDLLADTIPSTRWSAEKLAEYAMARGLDVKGMSKNAILRKIRGA